MERKPCPNIKVNLENSHARIHATLRESAANAYSIIDYTVSCQHAIFHPKLREHTIDS